MSEKNDNGPGCLFMLGLIFIGFWFAGGCDDAKKGRDLRVEKETKKGVEDVGSLKEDR